MDEESRYGMVILIKLGLLISMLGLLGTIIDIITTPSGEGEDDGNE